MLKKKQCLDLDTIGQEELTSDKFWYDEELLGDNEVQKKKGKSTRRRKHENK